jgi:hypothetical protein
MLVNLDIIGPVQFQPKPKFFISSAFQQDNSLQKFKRFFRHQGINVKNNSFLQVRQRTTVTAFPDALPIRLTLWKTQEHF